MITTPYALLRKTGASLVLFIFFVSGCISSNKEAHTFQDNNGVHLSFKGDIWEDKVVKSDKEWRTILTDEQYYVMRKKGTEPAFSGKYDNFKEEGIFRCAGCGIDLFSSENKFDSGTGWPSYWKPVSENNIKRTKDNSFFMKRTEVLCSRCDAHLGHLFTDGPEPTGLRYCINSVALQFDKKNQND